MKTAVIASPLIASESMQGSIMGMDAQGMNQATYFMRDKIYSNKIGAVVREYACNAIDEHVKWSVDRPVEIGIRNEGADLIFFVRDYANGLNDHDVRNVFGMYFRSTKSGTNESIGGFGIGSKAGHCYNDTFFVTSYFKGEKTSYTCMLGGGDTGVPVGHIYEIDKCACSEKGLEISMPINRNDEARFRDEIKKFVLLSPANIVAKFGSVSVSPLETVLEKQVDQFNFRLVKDLSGHTYGTSNQYVVQMGGVAYARYSVPHGYNVKRGHVLIVNLPIGSMSIPISRESFEDTPSNNKVRARVEEVVASLIDEDFVKFKDKTPLELINDALAAMSHAVYDGDIFSTQKSRLFQSVWGLVSNVRQSNVSGVLQKNGSKLYLISIPSNFATKYWVTKLMEFSKNTNRNYYFVEENVLQHVTVDISSEFEIKQAKRLDYPKTKRDTKRYSIGGSSGYSCGTFNPLELHNHAARAVKLPEVADEKEAAKQLKKYIDGLSNTYSLRQFVIADRTRTPKNTNSIGFYTSSDKFLNMMKDYGWLLYGTQEYKDAKEKILKKERAAEELQNAVASCKRRWLEFSPRTRKLIESRPQNALRIVKFWQCVRQEKTLRSKMIASFDHAGYGCPTYTRAQFRQILKLK